MRDVRYADGRGCSIAYEVFGSGPRDLVFVHGGGLPPAWEAVEFNPAHVAEQRKTNGKRGVKTDVVDARRCSTCWSRAAGYR